MACRLSIALLGALLVAAGANQAAVTPVQKVIQLLDDMVAKGTQEKQDEQVQFAKFKTFCDSTVDEKHRAIKDADEMIEVLQSDIEKHEAQTVQLTKEIAAHDADISTWEGDLEAATKVREIENQDYKAKHKDYLAAIDAVDEAVTAISAEQKDVEQKSPKEQTAEALKAAGLGLLQLNSIPEKSRKVIEKYFNHGVRDENLAVGAPEGRAYESQTTGVTDVLVNLGSKFDHEKTDDHDAEDKAQRDFEMLAESLRQSIDAASEARTEKAEAKARNLQKSADAKGQLVDTTGTRDADTKYVEDLIVTCEKKSADFANRQQLRGDEIVAVQQAIEILGSGAVAGNSEKNLPQLLQVHARSGAAFAQLRADPQNSSQQKVASYLKAQAVKLNSRVLSALATKVTADPFKKVKKMIKDLIVKLMEEAQAETEQKGWCDAEMSTNKHTREEKTEAVELLTADIDELQASVASLTDQIADLQKSVAELDEAVAKANEIRVEERAKNTQVVKEAQEAQVAVEKALAVLNDFYAKAAEATSFAQASHKAEPEIFGDEPYKGMGGESGGVVGMIEVIQSDFARLEADTAAAETAAAKEYEEFMSDSKVDKTNKNADLHHKSETKQNHENALQEKTHDLAGTEKELHAAMAYYEKLKPTCVETGVSYEDRVARRKEEIESLKTALRVLNNEDVV
jgi:hypothetical protein